MTTSHDPGSSTDREEPRPPGPGGFFSWIRSIHLRRGHDRWIAGVCGGVAERTGLDPMLVRGIALVVALLGGPVLILYAIAWLLVPDAEDAIVLERTIGGIFDPVLLAIAGLVVLGSLPLGQGLWWRGAPAWWGMPDWLERILATGWTVVLLAVVVWLVVVLARRSRPGEMRMPTASTAPRTDPPPMPRAAAPAPASGAARPDPAVLRAEAQRRSAEAHRRHQERMRERNARWRARQPSAALLAVSLGLALVAGALAALSATLYGWTAQPWVLGLAVFLAVVAIAIVVAGIRGRESGWLGLFAWIAVIGLVLTAVVPAGTRISPFGDTIWEVAADASPGPERFAMIAGSPTLDLTGITDRSPEQVEMWLGAGSAHVLLPADEPVRVEVDGLVTGIEAPEGQDSRGSGTLLASSTIESPAARSAAEEDITTVHVRMLLGSADIEIQEAS
ncbi:PspC domain-containing protein [Brachybacterium hainanense]|uniref:PspC domain-containing protein n=1 Tax=Brachybacterium hainanense TaxID=1541174 RepID=A0ABV6R8R8_9MICO